MREHENDYFFGTLSATDLYRIATKDPNPEFRMRAVRQMADQGVLLIIATQDPSALVRSVAIQNLTDMGQITFIIRRDSSVIVKIFGLFSLKSEKDVLQEFATSNDAIESMVAKELLAEISRFP